MRRFLSLLMAVLLSISPYFLHAQSLFFDGGSQYGQAAGQRRSMVRQFSPLSPQSFYDRAENESSLSEQSRSMQQQPGMSMSDQGGFGTTIVEYQVHVLGEVRAPGIYRVPPSTRVDEILHIAGGMLERGSHRRVEVRRDDGWQYCDLTRYRLRGDLNQNPFLLDNDVVFVPFAKDNVEIQGPVRRSGVYELVDGENDLWDLVTLAGGYTAGASFDEPMRVIRFDDGVKHLYEIPNQKSELQRFLLKDGDIAVVTHILTKNRRFDYNVSSLPADSVFYPSYNDNIFVMGAVALPGAYPFSPNYSIRDYVQMAGPMKYAKVKDVRVMTGQDRRLKHPDRAANFHLSPGDTIILPERAWTADNVIKWYNTVANSIITGFTLRELIRRN